MMATATPHRAAALELHRGSGSGEVSNWADLPQVIEKLLAGLASPPEPLSYLSIGGGPKTAISGSRGGPRNRADRESLALRLDQVANLIAAARHAQHIGLPLNRSITVHWQAAGLPLARMAAATGRFVDLLGKAVSRHGARLAWLWVHEGGEAKGGHCHLLAHIPADLVPVVTGLQRGWLRRITGKPYRARVICSRPIGGRLGLETGNPALHAVNLEVALAYVLKGAGEAAATACCLERVEHGGRVIGKRCGTSQNIGAKARKDGSK